MPKNTVLAWIAWSAIELGECSYFFNHDGSLRKQKSKSILIDELLEVLDKQESKEWKNLHEFSVMIDVMLHCRKIREACIPFKTLQMLPAI